MMEDIPLPGSDPPALTTRVGPRKVRRPRPVWGRRLLMLGGCFLVLGAAATVVVRSAVNRYLKSSSFTTQLTGAASRALEADCRIEDLSWIESSAHAGTFTADGRAGARFRRVEVADVRADFAMAGIWDRVWKVRQVRIAQVMADFSPISGLPGEAPRNPLLEAGPSPEASPPPGWLARWLPNRTEVGPVTVDRFDFVRKETPDARGVEGRGFALELKPEWKTGRVEVSGRSGELSLTGEGQKTLQVNRMRGTLRPEGANLDQFEGVLEEAQVSAEGTVGFDGPGELRLNLRLTGARLDRWLPEDWLKRCQGTGSARATLKGEWRRPETLRAEGDFLIRDALIQALPVLDIIARKTQNASFLRMQVKETAGQFERRGPDDWQVRRIRADAPGLLRLKGSINVGSRGALQGDLLLGIVPGTLRYLAGAEQTVFLSADRFSAGRGEAGSLTPDDTGLLWTRFALRGTLDEPKEDLSERLARAWFNATVDQVTSLSMEAAATAARTATGAANAVLQSAPPVLEKAPELLQQGVESGLKVLDSLLPR